MGFRRMAALGLAVAVVGMMLGLAGPVLAAGATMSIDPPTTSVSQGATFQVKVVVNAGVLSGAQATVVFDKSKLQVQNVIRGSAWGSSTVFLGADPKGIGAANSSGKLKTVAAAFLPPGSVPAGTADFLVIGFAASGCGDTKLTLPIGSADATLLDGGASYGAPIKVASTKPGSVTIACTGATVAPVAAGASGAPPPLASGAASLDPFGSPLPSDGSLAAPSGSAAPVPAAAGASVGPVPSLTLTSSVGSTNGQQDQQDAWLTFALASLGVAAAGLALIIVLAALALLIAGTIGLVWFVRTWRGRSGEPSTPNVQAGTPAPSRPASGSPAPIPAPSPAMATAAGGTASAAGPGGRAGGGGGGPSPARSAGGPTPPPTA